MLFRSGVHLEGEHCKQQETMLNALYKNQIEGKGILDTLDKEKENPIERYEEESGEEESGEEESCEEDIYEEDICKNDERTESIENNRLEELLEELNSLIGLSTVKEEVNSLINLIKVRKMREKFSMPVMEMSYHMVFTGNPGTGKIGRAHV